MCFTTAIRTVKNGNIIDVSMWAAFMIMHFLYYFLNINVISKPACIDIIIIIIF